MLVEYNTIKICFNESLTQIILESSYGNSQAFKTMPINVNVQATFLHYSGNVAAVF